MSYGIEGVRQMMGADPAVSMAMGMSDEEYLDYLSNQFAKTDQSQAASPTSSAASIPTHESAKTGLSKWETVSRGLGDTIDSWNKGNWAMEEENNRRAGEGADRTMSLLRMIPSMYEARNNARKANFGLAGMAGQ